MLKRIGTLFFGLALLGSVIYLGWLASITPSLVIWFGVASAILAPAGFALIGFSLRAGENELLKKLSKVSELQELIEKAQNQEEKIKALETERKHLEEVVKFEALRSSLLERKLAIEQSAVALFESLEAVDEQLNGIEVAVKSSPNRDVLENLRERVRSSQRGDIEIQFGVTGFVINTKTLQSLPGGDILLVYIRGIRELLKGINKIGKRF
jgi:hypothetical protein